MSVLTHIRPSHASSDLVDQRGADVQDVGEVFASYLAGADERDVGFGQFRLALFSVVLTRCRRFKMFWIDALGHVTKVMQVLPGWNRTNFLFIDVPVGKAVGPVDEELSILAGTTWVRGREISDPDVTWSIESHITNLKLLKPLVISQRASNVPSGELCWSAASTSAKHPADCTSLRGNNKRMIFTMREEE